MQNRPTNKKALAALFLTLSCVGFGARVSAQGTDEGYQLWRKFQCDLCHYDQGYRKASATSNPLAGTPLPFEAFAALTRYPVNRMPPYSRHELNDEELRAIWEYVRGQPPSPEVEDIPVLKEWLEALE